MSTELEPRITDDQVRALPLEGARADLLRELLAETGATAQPVRRPRRWLAPLAAAAAVLAIGVPVGIGVLGGDDPDGSGRVADPGTPAPERFQIRRVETSTLYPEDSHPRRAEVDAFTCPLEPQPEPAEEEQLACDDQGVRYLLGPAVIDGGIESAEALIPQQEVNYVVAIQFDEAATATFTELSRKLIGTADQFAIVVDGELLSAPTMNGLISNGQVQIGGSFTRAQAEALAEELTAG